MALTMGTAKPTSLSMGTNYGTQTTSAPQTTSSPQTTVSAGYLQPAASAYQVQPTGSIYTPSYNTGAGGGTVLGLTAAEQAAQQQQIAQQQAAAQAEAARVNGIRNSANVKREGYEMEANTGFRDNKNMYGEKNTGFINDVKRGQNTINSNRANNALNLRRSMASIASGVRQGMRSGGVDLANMNALDSGAADALARAWARAGGLQSSSANNEAQLTDNTLNTEQTNLDLQRTQGLASIRNWRATETDRVSNKLYNSLRALDADAAAAGVNGVVDLGLRDRLVAQAAAELDAIDRTTNDELAKIGALTPEQVNAQAFQMEQAGTQLENPFAIEAVGQGFQAGSGAPLGQFNTRPRYRDEQSPAYNPFRQDEQSQVAL